ncbi:MAG: hypothetical protein QT02_C0004G0042 [archaeon GW2011_AR9]|nr:MAG: hypothetical protein QT02_C0004G0042 [archaeon GW2011_AR9]MBS3120388.1 hypothetical protein [Candidatus Woesearchaeota archaeon]HIG93132.1 hypothetical protein [Candidatus Woesearchaeota archaeon]HIH13145.1 hypothetical protein [Candidatus Woesearchaeota archaeon]
MEKDKIHPHPVGMAAGLTSGIIYVVCTAAVALWQTRTVAFFATWFHGIDLMKIAIPLQLTWGSFLGGLLGIVVVGYLVGLIFGAMYNLCYGHCKKRKWI